MFKENKAKTATKAEQAFVSFAYCRFSLFFVCKSKCLMFAFVSTIYVAMIYLLNHLHCNIIKMGLYLIAGVTLVDSNFY